MSQAQAKAEQVELTPDIRAALQKLLERRAKAKAKSMENVKAKYPWANPASAKYDEEEEGYTYEVKCVNPKCGVVHRRLSSDLFQTKGFCPECQDVRKKAAKAAKSALMKKALALYAEGKIKLDEPKKD
jgi:hypothetical protein